MEKLGKPRAFVDEKAFMDKFQEYIEDCEIKEKLPNVAGFCFFARIGRTTFYDQKVHYPNTYELINSQLEDSALNNQTLASPILALYLKNKCGYTDKQEIETNNVNVNKNIDMSKMDTEELKKLLREEE